MDNQLSLNENNVIMYICNDCEYATKRKTDYNKHILTRKHIQITMDNGLSSNGYTCECGKTYQHQSGLCKHRHKCKVINNVLNEKKTNIANDRYSKSVPLARYYDQQLVTHLDAIYNILQVVDERLKKLEKN